MLFPESPMKSKLRPSARARKRLRIPTGKPRLVESSALCQERAAAVAWKRLVDAISSAAVARLALLRGRVGKERTPCPWEPFTGCCVDCRCCGERLVTVDFLRAHYGRLAIEIALLALPSSMPMRKNRKKS
jgi:hypothetical protein